MQPKCGSEGMGNLLASRAEAGLDSEERERAAREAARATRASVRRWRRRKEELTLRGLSVELLRVWQRE